MTSMVRRCAARYGAEFLLAAVITGLLVNKASSAPPLWFDEGFNLALARTWAQSGQYGIPVNGAVQPTDLVSCGLPVIAPLALSLKLFGVGAWQARLPGGLFVAGLCILSYVLARSLYGRKAALAAVAAALFVSARHIHLSTILLGRQALGEVPALCYMLAGFACIRFVRRWRYASLMAAAFWCLALLSKPQVLPFFTAALALPIVALLAGKQRREAGGLGLALAGALAGYAVWERLQALLLGIPPANAASAGDNIWAALSKLDLVVVPNLAVHLAALRDNWAILLLPVSSLVYAGWRLVQAWRRERAGRRQIVGLGLLVFAGTWLLWWAFLSIGWLRHLFPGLFVSSIFVGAFLIEVLAAAAKWIRAQGMPSGRSPGPAWPLVGAAYAGLLLLLAVPPTVQMMVDAYGRDADASLFTLASDLNAATPPGARFETYESELFFLLDRPYHFPPNSVQNQLNRRIYLGQDSAVDYDPLAADPDYLVVGPMGKLWGLYDSVIKSGEFHLLRHYTRYDLYERGK